MRVVPVFFIIFIFFLGMLFPCVVSAETIRLKNSSRAFEGDIVEHTDEYVVLKSGEGNTTKILFSKMDEETEKRLRAKFTQEDSVRQDVEQKFAKSMVVSYDELSDAEKEYVDQNYKTISTVHLNVADAESYRQKALTAAGQGDFRTALENIELAIQNGGPQAELYRFKGDVLHQSGQFPESIDAYTEALRLDSSVSDVYCNRGHAYFLMQNFDQAIADYVKGVELDAGNWLCVGNRANAYLLSGDLDEAEQDFKRLETADPVYAKIGLGNVMLAKGDSQRALAYYHQVVEAAPDAGAVYANMATAYLNLGDVDRAKQCVEKAESLGIVIPESFHRQLKETK